MLAFLVGGAVRDQLMGIPARDKDYVVIGSSREEMISLGYEPVGSSFPVFLNPQTKDEYTLASSLEADLARRDLTINAMARSDKGELIDPFQGHEDLKRKILRHVSDYFQDDPLRVYRVARFKAQFPEFSIAPETLTLMKSMIKRENFQQLAGERIFGELKKALITTHPYLFFEILADLQVLVRHMFTVNIEMLKLVVERIEDPVIRFGSLMIDAREQDVLKLCQRLLVPNDWLEAALVVCRYYHPSRQLEQMPPAEVVNFFYKMDAFRKPWLLNILKKLSPRNHILKYYHAIADVTRQDIAEGLVGKEIGEAIKAERIRRLTKFSPLLTPH